MSWVELSGLRKAFSGVPALHDFTMSIAKGEFVSLLGPSGCGKTTTLRIIAGFEVPDAGALRVGGEDILSRPAHKRGMGVVFQNYALFPHLSAAENVAFGMRIAKRPEAEIRKRVGELLEVVGLADAAGKMPRQLSGGQQQRIALARALAVQPSLLLLDEPLSALDAVVRVTLRDEIRRIQSALGITTIWVTHDQEEALAVSDRIAVMNAGRIEQVGPPEDIYSRPASRFVARFIGKMNQIDGELTEPGLVRWGSRRLAIGPQGGVRLPCGAMTVLVRPEAVVVERMRRTGALGDNCFAATVGTTIFLGGSRRLHLDVDGTELIADVPASAGAFHHGEAVAVTIPPQACYVLAHDHRQAGAP